MPAFPALCCTPTANVRGQEMGGKKKTVVGNLAAEYWSAVAQGIDAENRKATLFVRQNPSLGLAREAILRNLVERQTPAPFTVATGFAFAYPDPSIQPEPHF